MLDTGNFINLLACPECRSALIESSKDIKCSNCGKLFPLRDGILIMYDVSSAPGDLSVSIESWNKIYKETSTIEVEKTYKTYTERLLADIMDHFYGYKAIKMEGVFLEIGSGLSILGTHMAKIGYRVICIDVCEEALKKAKALYERRGVDAVFICGNILKMPLRDNSIDLSFGRGVIEHFRDTNQSVKELYRVAVPGGAAINTVPPISISTMLYRIPEGNIPNLPVIRPLLEWIFMGLLKGRRSVHGYELSFTAGQLRNLFSTNGFESIDTGWRDYYVPIKRLKSERLKGFIRSLFHHRLFWHVMYVNARKPKKGQ
jgi:ubiquinone/menaquinone biosynthesis C-methylase UbiE